MFWSFTIKHGSQWFWVDKWLANAPLSEQYPCLYNIARHKQHTIVDVLSPSPLNISWRRHLIWPKLTSYNELVPRIANITLTQEQDDFRWSLYPKGQFSVKSDYSALIHLEVHNLNKIFWKIKAPPKIKNFLWYFWWGVILTIDNLAQRNWQNSETCWFCHKMRQLRTFSLSVLLHVWFQVVYMLLYTFLKHLVHY